LGLMDENELMYPLMVAMMKSNGMTDESKIDRMLSTMYGIEKVPDDKKAKKTFSAEELIGREFNILTSPYLFRQKEGSEDPNEWEEKAADGDYAKEQAATYGRKVKIVGILRIKEGITSGALDSNIVYGKGLTQALLAEMREADVVKYQAEHPECKSYVNVEEEAVLRSISLYASSFENKDYIAEVIDAYNADEEKEDIEYTDYMSILLSSITTIINAVSYVLIGFVSISLVVSSIMIGIITYISVLERIKEIGILRALGASKKDVSRVFNAETLIIGFTAGMIGILVTVLLDIPISLVIYSLANIRNVAVLPLGGGIVLVLISMFLTFIAGLIPSRIASKKDPVVALRTE
ncbi:MAG: ABC transporter permease, partial [Clostridia bacterium]|nr:ABC transporter permease [Clostridia bacterium]